MLARAVEGVPDAGHTVAAAEPPTGKRAKEKATRAPPPIPVAKPIGWPAPGPPRAERRGSETPAAAAAASGSGRRRERLRSRTIDALTELALRARREGEVQRIVCRAIGQLRQTTCGPHHWNVPEPGDHELWCPGCERRIHYDDLTPTSMSAIVRGYARRHGELAAADFLASLYLAIRVERADRLRRENG